MVHYQVIHYPHCYGTDLHKNGKTLNGTQRCFCKKRQKYFQMDYFYNACNQCIKEMAIEMTLNSSGIRDI